MLTTSEIVISNRFQPPKLKLNLITEFESIWNKWMIKANLWVAHLEARVCGRDISHVFHIINFGCLLFSLCKGKYSGEIKRNISLLLHASRVRFVSVSFIQVNKLRACFRWFYIWSSSFVEIVNFSRAWEIGIHSSWMVWASILIGSGEKKIGSPSYDITSY